MKKTVDSRMHSAEHILNQTMDRMFQCGRCFNAHVEKKKSKCDYHFDHALSESDIQEIESRVNQIIQQDQEVTEIYMSKEEAQRSYNLGKVPSRVKDIRIVKIGDYDACPCIGPHVEHTREIGSFQIVSTNFNEGVFRIRFKLTES